MEHYVQMARAIITDRKAEALIAALKGTAENKSVFDLASERGAARKAVVFTESLRTQEYLRDLMAKAGFEEGTILINGSNSDDKSKRIYAEWKKRNKDRWGEVSSGSKTADMKAAIVEEFKERGTILLATESAAEGVNLQFCSIVVNYDLPWNPQRIEQRIGRCHRYGQKSDVLVVNMLNRGNAADVRVFEILSQKFRLFAGVFGVSDDVGVNDVETALNFERRVGEIFQNCRKPEEIAAAFDALQEECETEIAEQRKNARSQILENFDPEVHEKLRIYEGTARAALDDQQSKLMALARYALKDKADFDADEPRFRLHDAFAGDTSFDMRWPEAQKQGDAFFRIGHPLAEKLLADAKNAPTPAKELSFTFKMKASALERYKGTSGWLAAQVVAATALDRREEFLLVAASDADGDIIDAEVARKFFLLDAAQGAEAPVEVLPAAVAASLAAQQKAVLAHAEDRHEEFFEEEAEKLDRRREDLEAGLSRDIKVLDAQIKEAKKEARRVKGLQEKLGAQRIQRDLEKRRDEKQQQIYVEQGRIRAESDGMIERLQKQLAETKVETRTLFTARWTLA